MMDYPESYKRSLAYWGPQGPNQAQFWVVDFRSSKWDATVSACPSNSTEPAEPRTRSRRLGHNISPRVSRRKPSEILVGRFRGVAGWLVIAQKTWGRALPRPI